MYSSVIVEIWEDSCDGDNTCFNKLFKTVLLSFYIETNVRFITTMVEQVIRMVPERISTRQQSLVSLEVLF